MPKVFVVQVPHEWRDGKRVPCHDVSAAERWGEVVVLLSPTANPLDPSVLQELTTKLGAQFMPGDYLLCSGSPALLCIAAVQASFEANDNLRILQWSRKEQDYDLIDVEFDMTEGDD